MVNDQKQLNNINSSRQDLPWGLLGIGSTASLSGGDRFKLAEASIRMSTLLESDMLPASLQSDRFPVSKWRRRFGEPPNEVGVIPHPGAEVVGVPVLSPELEDGREVGVVPPGVLWVKACCFMLPWKI